MMVYTDTNLIPGQIYYYRITAVEANENESDFSSEVYITTAPTASISGQPSSHTKTTSATLTAGGSGVTHYKYKLDDEETYSDVVPVATEISLTNLVDGSPTNCKACSPGKVNLLGFRVSVESRHTDLQKGCQPC